MTRDREEEAAAHNVQTRNCRTSMAADDKGGCRGFSPCDDKGGCWGFSPCDNKGSCGAFFPCDKSRGPDHRPRRDFTAIDEANSISRGVDGARRQPQSVGDRRAIEIGLEVTAGAERPRQPRHVGGAFVEDAVAKKGKLPPGRGAPALRRKWFARSDRDRGRPLARDLYRDLPAGVRRADDDDRTLGKIARPAVIAAVELQHGRIEV